MEANYPPEELFSKAYSRFYESLKKRYQIGIEKATDKDYAKDYYCRTLFAENTMIPRYSVFFHSLISTFTHYRKIGEENPLQRTLESLSAIREMTSNIIEQTFIIQSSISERLYQLNWLYQKAIEENNISILELVDTEQRVLKYSNEKAILLLAFVQATKELHEEFSEKPKDNMEVISSEYFTLGEQSHGAKLTRSQQVLIAYYISQLIGAKHKKNVSKCADALHNFLGIPYTEITHSELYKKMLRPLMFSSEKATLQNLRIVRSFFEQLEAKLVLELIDADIKILSDKPNSDNKSLF